MNTQELRDRIGSWNERAEQLSSDSVGIIKDIRVYLQEQVIPEIDKMLPPPVRIVKSRTEIFLHEGYKDQVPTKYGVSIYTNLGLPHQYTQNIEQRLEELAEVIGLDDVSINHPKIYI